MDYLGVFDISASGMNVERMRVDITAANLANANTTRSVDGGPYKPLRLIAVPKQDADFGVRFGSALNAVRLTGVEVGEVLQVEDEPRMVYEPSHPDADERGFVAYPSVNSAAEMVNLITATRSYEANVRAMNAAKAMALKALEIGGGQ